MRARERNAVTATIGVGASLSGAVGTGGLDLQAIIVPSGWDAADITFQASHDGTNYYDCYIASADTEVTVQASASRYITIPAGTINGASWLKVRSGTTGSAVNQADAVTLTLLFATAV